MVVKNDDLPPSRAGSLALVADDLALDFANTESGRGSELHVDHLREANDVADWLEHANVLDPADAEALRGAAAADPALGQAVLAEALRLRAAIQAAGVSIAKGAPPPDDALRALAAIHARCIGGAELAADGRRCRWRWTFAKTPALAALGPIALAAVALVSEGDHARIKQCGGYACGWLFYDLSKNMSRRWCEMEVCGNRAKQRRLAERRRRR